MATPHLPQRSLLSAQTAAVIVVASLGAAAEGKLVYFMTIENARFRKPVGPGDQLRLHCKKEKQRLGVWRFSGEARVGDTVVAEEFTLNRDNGEFVQVLKFKAGRVQKTATGWCARLVKAPF